MSKITDIVCELGGDPEATDVQNLQLLSNEIIILREKLDQARDAEGRAERRLGVEINKRIATEVRAVTAESALTVIDYEIARAKKKALENGAPLRIAEDAAAELATRR